MISILNKNAWVLFLFFAFFLLVGCGNQKEQQPTDSADNNVEDNVPKQNPTPVPPPQDKSAQETPPPPEESAPQETPAPAALPPAQAPAPEPPAETPAPAAAESPILVDFSTGLFDYSKNRLKNIRLACKKINGAIVGVGETFSFNETVGRRTAKRGFRKAYIFKGKEKEKEVGGGICQISSTLYNAALLAGFEIVERHEHSQPVDYVEKGKDATIYFGSLDFKFKNNGTVPIVIKAKLHGDRVQIVFEKA